MASGLGGRPGGKGSLNANCPVIALKTWPASVRSVFSVVIAGLDEGTRSRFNTEWPALRSSLITTWPAFPEPPVTIIRGIVGYIVREWWCYDVGCGFDLSECDQDDKSSGVLR